MKKSLISALFLGAVCLASCQKQDQPNPMSVVRIGYTMMDNSMYHTKAVESTDVLYAIQTTLPPRVDYTATDGNGATLNGRTNEDIVIAEGTYRFQGSWSGERVCEDINEGSYLSLAPRITIDQDLTIEKRREQYTLNATYQCFCLVVETAMVDKVFITDTNGNEQELPMLTSGKVKIVFAHGRYDSNYIALRLVPVDTENYRETNYTITTTMRNFLGYAEFGKFYVLTCTEDGVQPKMIGYSLPDMEQGDLMNH